MATYTAPPTIDCQIMEFKHLCKIKTAHDVSKTIYKRPTCLIAVSSMYGLTFVGEYCNLKIIASNHVFEERSQNFDSKTILYDYLHRDISMPTSPTHVDINSEQKLLSVAFCMNEIPVLRIYVIESFFCENVIILSEIKLSSASGTYVTDLSWNPGISNILACCISDGTLSTYTFNAKGDLEVKSLPKESNSVCVCWSPKGKQIVVGNYNGFLTQYLPELKALKNYPPPSDLFSKPCSLCSIKWLSTFQFIGVYKSQEQYLNEEEETKSCVVVVNTPKNGPITYVNYEDICFSGGTERPIQYYFIHIQTWNLIFVASSNAVEIAVLSLSEDNVTWVLWTLEDSARITLPMVKAEETYPVGVALDCSFPIQTPIGDKIVSMPVLSVLTNEGLICVYLINYMNPSVTSVCVKANPLPSLKYFTTSSVIDQSASKNEPSDTSLVHVDVRTSSQLPTCSYIISDCTNSIEYAISNSEEVTYTVVSSSVPVLAYQTPAVNTSSTANIVNVTSGICTTKESTSELISVSANLSSQESVTRNVTTSDLPSTGIASVKNTEPQKLRNDLFKKLKKRVSVFENDIQEIKYLVGNLEIDIGEKSTQDECKLLTLENKSKKLKERNAELHREIDELRPLIIEIFAYVQDVKSKYLQLQNPGYQLLSGIQDVDPVTKNNLEAIEKTIDYIQSQVQKADKQLEEMWYKFSENPFVITTKIPVLENVYETLMKQQKILSLLKRRTEKLEKNITNVACHLARGLQLNMSNISRHYLTNTITDDESALVQLTNRGLNLYSSSNDHLDSRSLAQHFSKRHAKRFHLSYVKQIKLQELLSTGNVTYIQSSRLLRLKKKSLIVLSRSCTNEDQEINERKMGQEEIVKTRMVSPVSSEDLDIFYRQTYVTDNQSVVASTPLKSKQLSQFNISNVLTIEPSNNQLATAALNKITFTVPNTVSVAQVDPKTKQNDVKLSDPICITSVGEPRLSVSKESNLSLGKSSASLNTLCLGIGQTTHVPSTSLVLLNQNFTPAVTAKMIDTTNNFLENVKPSGTALSTAFSSLTVPFSNAGTSFPTVSLPVRTSANILPLETATTRAIMATTITTTTAIAVTTTSVAFSSVSMLMNNTADLKITSCSSAFSFAAPKSETLTATSSVSSANSACTSLFNLRPSVDSAFTSAAISSSLETGNSHFKSISGTLSPSVGNCITVSSDASSSTETTSLSKNVTVTPILNALTTVYNDVATTSSSVFSGIGSIFGKPSTTSATTINFGSILPPSSSMSINKAFAAVTPAMNASASELKEKNHVFNTFSFTRKPNDEVMKVSEVTIETNVDLGNVTKENAAASTTSSNISFSFANLTTASTFTPVKSLGTFDDAIPTLQPTTTATTVAIPVSVSLSNSSTLFNSHSATQASAVPVACSGSNIFECGKPVTSAIETAAPVTTVTVSACTTSNSSITFGTTDSFFAGLNINSTTTAVTGSSLGKPVTGSITAAPVFGSGGNNIFPFSTTVPDMTTTNNLKPIFGTGKSSFFSESGGAVVGKTESVFGSSSNVKAQGSRGPTFVSSPLFSSETNFVDSNAATVQPNSFRASSGNSLFGSGDIAFSTPSVSSPFQNTASAGFGSPPTFSSGLQQPVANSGGFGSPPTFSNVFNKPSSFTAFGAAPTFGGSPTFSSSPTKMFGQSTSNLGPFGGAVNQSPTTFEALANENTVSFGNLAQQQPSGFGSPAFNNTNSSAFGVSSNFGGNAFSSWR